MSVVKYRLTGTAPYIMHAPTSVDPRHPATKAFKALTGKRKKTDTDHELIARSEFNLGLYVNKERQPVMPMHQLAAALIEGAKDSKDGPKAKAGCFIVRDALLEYDGPQDANDLYDAEDGRFVHTAIVRNQQARVMRTRPIFHEWQAVVEIEYADDIANPEEIENWLASAGRRRGIGDHRPQYGRFSVEALDEEITETGGKQPEHA